jgi:hypothetical protein
MVSVHIGRMEGGGDGYIDGNIDLCRRFRVGWLSAALVFVSLVNNKIKCLCIPAPLFRLGHLGLWQANQRPPPKPKTLELQIDC